MIINIYESLSKRRLNGVKMASLKAARLSGGVASANLAAGVKAETLAAALAASRGGNVNVKAGVI